jgi:hypothetical protein
MPPRPPFLAALFCPVEFKVPRKAEALLGCLVRLVNWNKSEPDWPARQGTLMGIGCFIFDPRDPSVMAISYLIQSLVAARDRLESVIMAVLALRRCSADTGGNASDQSAVSSDRTQSTEDDHRVVPFRPRTGATRRRALLRSRISRNTRAAGAMTITDIACWSISPRSSSRCSWPPPAPGSPSRLRTCARPRTAFCPADATAPQSTYARSSVSSHLTKRNF